MKQRFACMQTFYFYLYILLFFIHFSSIIFTGINLKTLMDKNEIILEKNNNFVTRYGGTLENDKPSVLYLRTKAKITPLINKKEYNIEVNKIKHDFKTFVEKAIKTSKSVQNDFLFNVDISEKSMRYGKVSFLRYDIYLKPTKKRTLKENLHRIKQLSLKLDQKLEKLLNSNNIFCK